MKNSVIYKKLHYHLYPTIKYLRERKAITSHEAFSDPRQFNWDWTQINFNRVALVNFLLAKFANPAYLEIGCADNALYDSVPARDKVGVDPVSGGNVRQTSDEFFQQNNKKFDVIFIDGLHTYEQVRKDVVNAIECLKPGGFIALHDMLPRNWLEHHTPQLRDGPWTGDVWKVAFELADTTGIKFSILKIDHGVGLLRLVNNSILLSDMQSDLTSANFNFFADNLQKLPIMDWDTALKWLDELGIA
jgi:hypothetical protein